MLVITRGELNHYFKILLGVFAPIIAIFLIYILFVQLSSVIVLFISSLVFVFLARPLVEFFNRGKIKLPKGKELHMKLPRIVAVVLVYLLIICLFVVVLVPAFQVLIGQARTLSEAFSSTNLKILKETVAEWLSGITNGISTETLKTALDSVFEKLQSSLGAISGFIVKGLADIATAAAGILFQAFIILIISTFFLLDWKYINAALFALLPNNNSRNNIKKLLASVYTQIWGYVRTQFLLSLFTGTLIGLLCFILGVPSALIIGIIVALGEMVPYIGPLFSFSIGLLLAAVAALPTPINPGGSFYILIGFVLGFLVIEQGLAQAIAAPVLAKKAQTHPLLVIVVMFSFYNLFGPMSVLLAVPFLVTLKAIFAYLTSENKLFKRLGIDLESYYQSNATSPLIARLRQPFSTRGPLSK
ncbi:MAG: AI-2E family transporter [Caldisericales bacterium]|nr:AI-2E family transporter [Caldisericales bacterium]